MMIILPKRVLRFFLGTTPLDATLYASCYLCSEVERDVPTRSASASRGPEQNALLSTPRPCARRRTAPQGARIASRGTKEAGLRIETAAEPIERGNRDRLGTRRVI